LINGTAFPLRTNLQLRAGWAANLSPAAVDERNTESSSGLQINFLPDPTIYDGRFSNNGWLQELPKPISKLTWDNAAIVSPKLAEKLGISQTFGTSGGEHGQAIVDLVELELDDRTVRAPAWILPGHADDTVTVHMGYGRTAAGRVGSGAGFNAFALR